MRQLKDYVQYASKGSVHADAVRRVKRNYLGRLDLQIDDALQGV